MALKVDFDRVAAIIDGLMPEDIVELHWCDASKNRRVKRIDNKVVACYKKLTARFVQLSYDTAYGIEHILLEDITEGEMGLPTIWSIPRSVVIYAAVVTNRPTKETSDIGTMYLGGRDFKVVTVEGGLGDGESRER